MAGDSGSSSSSSSSASDFESGSLSQSEAVQESVHSGLHADPGRASILPALPNASFAFPDAPGADEEQLVFSRRRGRPRKYPPGTTDSEARKIRAALNQGIDYKAKLPNATEYFIPAVQEFSIRTRRQAHESAASSSSIPASMISPAAKIAEVKGGFVTKNALRTAMEADAAFLAKFPPADAVPLQIPDGVKLRPVRGGRDPDAKPLGRPPKKSRLLSTGGPDEESLDLQLQPVTADSQQPQPQPEPESLTLTLFEQSASSHPLEDPPLSLSETALPSAAEAGLGLANNSASAVSRRSTTARAASNFLPLDCLCCVLLV